MKLSWSHKLFFKINKQIGKRPRLDKFMIFCARWLLFVIVLGFLFLLTTTSLFASPLLFFLDDRIYFSPIVWTIFISFLISYIVAILWKHPRPIREFSTIKVLVTTLGGWKSFPSDHTIAAVLLAIGVWLIASTFVAIVFFLATICVACSRVYVGVHYPRDILGGAVIPIAVYVFLVRIAEGLPNFFL